jgi:hypothetical protein
VISSDLHSFRSESEGPEPFDIQISIVENILLDKLNHIRLCLFRQIGMRSDTEVADLH